MWRAALLAAALCACQPKQPLQASYFNADKEKQAPPKCGETLACYGKCDPLTEECMLLCDQKTHARQAELARAVTYCSARHGCADDQACIDEKCGKEKQMCVSPTVAPAPSPMQPMAYPGQAPRHAAAPMHAGPMQPAPMHPAQPAPMQPPPVMQPQPYPGQPTSTQPRPMSPPPLMQPQPYPGQPTSTQPRPMSPPPVMQPQPYPGQPGYRPPPPPPGYRPPPPPAPR